MDRAEQLNMEVMSTLLGALIAAGLIALIVAARGLVLSILWGWFVTPLGLPAIGIAHGAGLAATFSLLGGKQSRDEKKQTVTKSVTESVIVIPGVALVIGFILHLIMVS